MSLSPVMVELRAGISQFTAKMAEARAEVTKLQTEGAANMAKFQSVGKGALLGVAAATVVVGVASLKMAGDFQQQTSVFQTAAGETTNGLKAVRSGILDISRSTGTTWQNLASGMYQLEKAGYTAANGGLLVLKAAAQGAKEEGANLGTVTSALTSIMASYHIPAAQAVMVMDEMKTAAGRTKDSMENYAASLSTVLPIASAAHISFASLGGDLSALTQHGTTAHEATQELAGTIRGLLTPLPAAQKAMAQLGISSVDVSQNLGKRGVSGTIQVLTQVIASHVQGGLVQIGMMRQSASATDDLNKMMQQMTPVARGMAQDLMNNTVTVKEYRKEAGNLDPVQAAMARQFATLSLKAKGFSDAAKAGLPVQTTMDAQLRAMTGGALGLNTALMLSGQSMDYANTTSKMITESAKHAGKEVEGWDRTQRLFNTAMDRMKATVNAAFIEIGMHLIPVVTAAMDLIAKHKTTVEVMAVAIGTFLVAAIAAYVASLAGAAAKSIVDFAKMTAAALKWVAEQVAAMVRLGVSIDVVVAKYATMAAKSVLNFLKMSAAAVASSASQVIAWGSAAAAATAAFIAENLATLGIAAAIALLIAAVVYAATHWHQIWDTIKSVAGAAKDFIVSHIGMISPAFGPVVAVLTGFASVWRSIWNAIAGVIRAVGAEISAIVGGIGSAVSSVANAISTVSSIASGVGSAVKSVIPGFAGGVENYSGGLALVGEKGPELVNLPRGSSVHTAAETGQMLGNDNSRVEELLGMLLDKVDRMPMQMTAMRRAG